MRWFSAYAYAHTLYTGAHTMPSCMPCMIYSCIFAVVQPLSKRKIPRCKNTEPLTIFDM